MGLILLVFALPSVSAISLSISASGWPPCPASTDTSYTITARVTGSTPIPTFLVIAIWDYVEGRYIANTGAISVPRGRIDVTRTLTIRTPRVAGEISYAAVVLYWDWRIRMWMFGSAVNSGTRMASTPSANIVNVRIDPSPLTIPSPTRDITGRERNVTFSWSLQGTTTRLSVRTVAYYNEPLWFLPRWVQISDFMQRNVVRSFSESFSITHRPKYSGFNEYHVAAGYYDHCGRVWRGWSGVTRGVEVRCDPVTYQPGRWNDNAHIKENNNCYNYGVDIQTDTFAWPGRSGGRQPNYTEWNINCSLVIDAARSDGLVHMGWGRTFSCPPCSHKVALAVRPPVPQQDIRGDFHWYREDIGGGFWSHKRGKTNATDTVNVIHPINTSKITNPEAAARFIRYTDFCGYFCAPKLTVNIQ